MLTFSLWLLLIEARQGFIPPSILHGYEAEFQRALEQLIQRTDDPVLKQKFEAMKDCPVRDSAGQCHTFTGYILAALVRHRVQDRYDIEAALAYVVQQMLMPQSISGRARSTLFGGFDPHRPYRPQDNPLQARFLAVLRASIANIVGGKIPRLSNRVSHPTLGTDIAARPADDLAEMVEDIADLLHQKEAAHGLPLVDLFRASMSGDRMQQQVARFGDRPTRRGRAVMLAWRISVPRSGLSSPLSILEKARAISQ